MPEITLDEKTKLVVATFVSSFGLSVKAVDLKYGDKGIAHLRKFFEKAGKKSGEEEIKKLKIKDRGPRGYHEILKTALEALNIEYKVRELSEQRYVCRIFQCPYAEYFRKIEAPPSVCDVFLGLDQGIVKALDPRLEFKLTKHTLRGAPYCEYVVEYEG